MTVAPLVYRSGTTVTATLFVFVKNQQDRANTMYKDDHVTVIFAQEMRRTYSDVNMNTGPRLTSL